MADQPTPTDAPTGMPRWVKISLLAVAALIAVFVILNLTGMAGDHGPMRHLPGRDAPASAAPGHGPGMHDR